MSSNQIILLIFFVEVPLLLTFSGLVGVYACNKINFLKKNINSNTIIWIHFFTLYFMDIVLRTNINFIVSALRSFGGLLITFLTALIYSLIRSRLKIKTVDAKFYYFYFGVAIISIISQINLIYREKF